MGWIPGNCPVSVQDGRHIPPTRVSNKPGTKAGNLRLQSFAPVVAPVFNLLPASNINLVDHAGRMGKYKAVELLGRRQPVEQVMAVVENHKIGPLANSQLPGRLIQPGRPAKRSMLPQPGGRNTAFL